MKKRLVKSLIVLIISATLIGCSNKEDAANASFELATESTESIPEETQEAINTVLVESKVEDTKVTTKVEAELSSEETVEMSSADLAAANANEENKTEKAADYIADNNKENGDEETTLSESQESDEPTEPSTSAPEVNCEIYPLDADMYAKCESNLRVGPRTEFDKGDSLNVGEKVHVTGLTSNGWFQLENKLFVYIDYLTSAESDTATDIGSLDVEFEIRPTDTEMYAKVSCNLRIAPNIDFETAGTLTKGEAVHVVGWVSTGWYRLENGLFVHMACLTSIKPEEPSQPSESEQPTEPTEPTEPSESEEVYTYEIYLLPELLTLVNEERTANGVNTFEWASDKEEDAKARARELVDDFSHTSPGGYNCSAECITMYGPDVQTIYNAYKNSKLHYWEITKNPDCKRFVSANCVVYLNGEFVDNYNVVMMYIK